MATTYTSTIKVRCWKEHTCVACGAVYAYELIRSVRGQASNAEKAAANAHVAAQKTMERDVDMQPCPTCGLFQPDMVGQQRARRYKLVFWLTLPVFGLILILRGVDVLQANTATWAAAAVCALASLALWAIDLGNPNRDTSLNRQLAEGRVAGGQVRHQPGQRLAGLPGADDPAHPARSLGHRLALLLLLVAFVLTALPELLRAQHNWPLNPDLYPPVAGPGDQSRVYMTDTIHSIKGYWRGRPRVVAHQTGDAGEPVVFAATSNQNDWGSTISVKSSEKNSSSTPWVVVSVPSDADLAGKTLACDIELNGQYPQATGSTAFQTSSFSMHRSLAMQLASATGAGALYNTWWWQATVVGMVLALVCALVLVKTARSIQRRAYATRISV